MERTGKSIARSKARFSLGVGPGGLLACVGLATLIAAAPTPGPTLAGSGAALVSGPGVAWSQGPTPEIVVYASDLPKRALSEFDFWDDPASPGGRLVGTPNTGDELDPPPENDPHVTFQVEVQQGVPYRCWIHMKVGAPKGKSQANRFWVQFSDAVDEANREVFRPRTESYLTARGPTREGWAWVGCDLEDSSPSESLVRFRKSGEVTVRLQAGQEGVGFDQFVLSPERFLEQPPTEAVLRKQ
jgi:hypothetical protein